MRKAGSLAIIILTIAVTGCNATGYGYVHEIDDSNYIVEASFDPRSSADKKVANLALKKRAEVACGGEYEVLETHMQRDLYWQEVIVLWEVSCNPYKLARVRTVL